MNKSNIIQFPVNSEWKGTPRAQRRREKKESNWKTQKSNRFMKTDAWIKKNGISLFLAPKNVSEDQDKIIYPIRLQKGKDIIDYHMMFESPYDPDVGIPAHYLISFLVGCAIHRNSSFAEFAEVLGTESYDQKYMELLQSWGNSFYGLIGDAPYQKLKSILWEEQEIEQKV